VSVSTIYICGLLFFIRCKENGCKAAFTTKQCLQFHYKKVHGLTEAMMPKIERSVAYTFDAYSGGLVEDVPCGRIIHSSRRNSQVSSIVNIVSYNIWFLFLLCIILYIYTRM